MLFIALPLSTDSEDWKEFISKPALPFALRLLTGLSRGHPATQQLVGRDILPVLHKLEQVSSDEHIGTAAENLMEALKESQQVKARVRLFEISLSLQCFGFSETFKCQAVEMSVTAAQKVHCLFV